MRDYVYPSVFLAYFFFFLCLCVALYFFFRSWRDGYWGDDAEEAKYRMLEQGDESFNWSGNRPSNSQLKKEGN
ncbi:MAG: hypothetical protein HYR56_05785 [Acidobacteria bacterium]|nr:hypothetical protein [Acidobacteriota bacterium]MBI3424729.1 hypothetical protein [Acidobacteriota bacterium]